MLYAIFMRSRLALWRPLASWRPRAAAVIAAASTSRRYRVPGVDRGVWLGALAVAALQVFTFYPCHETLDIPMWDEANYMGWADVLFGSDAALPGIVYSPLYVAVYRVLLCFVDRVEAVFMMKYLASTWSSVMLFAFLSVSLRSVGLAAALASVWVVAQENAAAVPFVCIFAMGVFCAALLAARRRPLLGFVVLCLAALARFEYVLLVAPAAVYWAWSWVTRPAADGGRSPWTWYRLTLGALAALVLLLTLAATRSDDPVPERSWHAFAQHYAQAQVNAGRFGLNPWLDYEVVLQRDFPGAHSVLDALRVSPELYGRFVRGNTSVLLDVITSLLCPAVALSHAGIVLPYIAALLGLLLVMAVSPGGLRRWLASVHASVRSLGGGVVVLGASPLCLLPSLILSTPSGLYMLMLLPVVLWMAGALVRALLDAPQEPRRSQLRGVPLAALLLVVVVLSEGTRPLSTPAGRPNLTMIDAARARWPERKTVLVGAHATFYASYLGRDRVEAYEALPAAYGGKTPPQGIGLDDLVREHHANAVLVNAELTDSPAFRRDTLALLSLGGWVPVQLARGDTVFFAPDVAASR